MLRLEFVFAGMLFGLLVCSVFVPPTFLTKVLPDPLNPLLIFKNPKVENGYFQVKSHEVPCTRDTDSLTMLSA